jgi:hypothetical protein
MVAAHEVLGVVDELLMNPVDFHFDDPSQLINDCVTPQNVKWWRTA